MLNLHILLLAELASVFSYLIRSKKFNGFFFLSN